MLCILSCCSLAAHAQQRVNGTVTDANGEPVIGANVVEKGTTNGIMTDVDGKFSLEVQADAVLRVSFIGYISQDIVVGNRSNLDVRLLEDAQALEEVVVIGYGTQKKVNLSGAVGTVSAKTLESRPVTNVNFALQGAAPNMNISPSNGNPTTAPEINIRGYTSINGGSAFILVDNVPVTPQELARMNPADIESVSVLKDAAASAIYGARAAFGVVLITTKTAKSDKLQISVDASYGVKQFFNLPEVSKDIYQFLYIQNSVQGDPNRWTKEQMEYAKRRMADPSLPDLLYPSPYSTNLPDVGADGWDYYSMTDWFDVALHDLANTYNTSVQISKKTDRMSYIVSGGYLQQNQLIRYQNPHKRYTLSGNATYDLTSWWSLGTNFSFAHTDFETAEMISTDGSGLFYQLHSKYTIRPIYNPDGSWTQDGGATVMGGLRDGGRYHEYANQSQISFRTQVDLLKDVWNVKADASFRFSNKNTNKWQIPLMHKGGPNASMGQSAGSNPSYAEAASTMTNYYVYNIYTDYHKTFGEKHAVQALLGFNQEQFYSDYNRMYRREIITQTLPTVNLATGVTDTYQTISELALRGYFGRLGYIYDNKYILEFNGRRDGTSRYPAGNRWGFFPSGSAGWVLSQEKFFEPVKDALKISMLKLRGSYGVLGNQVIKDANGNEIYYPYIATMSPSTAGPLIDGNPPVGVLQPASSPASDLTWEVARTINGGIDLSLFDGKFDASFDLYTRYTEGMLTKSKTLPALYGITEPRTNAADLKTKGWELNVGYRDEFTLGDSPFSWNLRLMLADSRAYITKYDNPDKILSDYYVGQELGEIWGYKTLGFFASDAEAAAAPDQSALGTSQNNYRFYAGDLKWEDVNNDGKINNGSNTANDPGDRKIIGNNRSRLPYSIMAGADWKGFDLWMLFQGIGKWDTYPNSLWFWGSYATPWTSPNTKNLDNWTPENPDAYFPRLKDGFETGQVQTKYLQDMSYMRLKSLTLGYTLPSSLTKNRKIDKLRIYFSGENLFTIQHVDVKGNDPELNLGTNYPFTRNYSIGVNLNF
jgi:TonB-linked SusC/RagA family outer membrane protein